MKQTKLVFSSLVNDWNSIYVPVKISQCRVQWQAPPAQGNIQTAGTL